MKNIFQSPAYSIITIDRTEEVFKTLISFANETKIQSAWFQGIGAASNLLISYYDLSKKQYIDKEINQEVEIISLTGNIASLKNEKVIHAHGVFSTKSFTTFGGHIKSLAVSATCEIYLSTIPLQIERERDEVTGLNLLLGSLGERS